MRFRVDLASQPPKPIDFVFCLNFYLVFLFYEFLLFCL